MQPQWWQVGIMLLGLVAAGVVSIGKLYTRMALIESRVKDQDKEMERQTQRVDGIEKIINEIKVQGAHILERIESLFSLLKQRN